MTDRFQLLVRIGRGGMGTVWRARNRATGEVVALKVLHEQYADDTQYLARFEREVDLGRSIDSPYVVRVLGYGRQDRKPYIAMEYVDGQSLRELVKAKGKLTWQEAEPIVAQVWAGLAAAHAVDVIHRDVKPSNILVGSDGVAKLADFGIARSMEATRLTGSSTMLGTPYYMAPDGDASHASDLYALGCVLYEMLAGVPPFEGDSPQKVLLRHLREEPDLGRIPIPARPLVEALLTKEPEARVERALPLLDGLELPPLPSPRRLPVPPPPRGPDWSRWRVALAGGGFLAAIVGVGALAATTSGGDDGGQKASASGNAAIVATQPVVDTATPTPTITPTATPTDFPASTATPTPTAVPPTAAPPTPTRTLIPSTPTLRPPTATPIPTATPAPTGAAQPATAIVGFSLVGIQPLSTNHYRATISYSLNGAGSSDWKWNVYYVKDCSDSNGTRIGGANGTGGLIGHDSPIASLVAQSGQSADDFNASILALQPSTTTPPVFPVTCNAITIVVGHWPNGGTADFLNNIDFPATTVWQEGVHIVRWQ